MLTQLRAHSTCRLKASARAFCGVIAECRYQRCSRCKEVMELSNLRQSLVTSLTLGGSRENFQRCGASYNNPVQAMSPILAFQCVRRSRHEGFDTRVLHPSLWRQRSQTSFGLNPRARVTSATGDALREPTLEASTARITLIDLLRSLSTDFATRG